MSRTERIETLGKVAGAGVTRITWTGGEPTLCRDLPVLLTQASQLDIQNVITTHGLNRSSAVMKALDKERDLWRISLDGMENEHNRIRGGPFFRHTLEYLELLSKQGHTIEVNISLMKSNSDDIPPLIRLLVSEFDVNRILLLTLMKRESTVDNDIKSLSPLEKNVILQLLKRLRAEFPNVQLQLNDYDRRDDAYIVIESDGDILLCSETRQDTNCGNILANEGSASLIRALRAQSLAHRQIPPGNPSIL